MGAVFRWIRDLWLGRRQLGQTTERAAAAITTPAAMDLFTIAGGRILVTQILGEIVGAMQALATNIYLQADPLIATGTTRDMCAALNVISYTAGNLLGITGVNTDAMLPPAMSGVIEGQTFGVIVQAGTIELMSDANNTGTIRWTLKWVPIDTGAAVVAA